MESCFLQYTSGLCWYTFSLSINYIYFFASKVKSENFLWFNCSDPNSQVNKRNWQLMAVTTSCTFPSNTRVQKYIQCHLRKCSLDAASEEGRYARFCHKVKYTVIFVFVWYFWEALEYLVLSYNALYEYCIYDFFSYIYTLCLEWERNLSDFLVL